MKRILVYIVVLVATVACNAVDVDGDPSPDGKDSASGMITEIISGRQVATKATINDETAAFAWTVGDNIAVHVSNTNGSHKYVTTADTGASGASATAAEASFTVVYDAGYSRDAFAVYPSYIVDRDAEYYGQTVGESHAKLDVTLPATYTLAQVSGETSPCPMIASNSNTDSNWEFYQLCGLLRLKVYSIPPSTNRLEINFNGKQVCGSFSIASPVTPRTSVIATTTLTDESDTRDIISIIPNGNAETLNGNQWLDEQVLNIPLPVVSTDEVADRYKDITITAYNAGGEALLSMTRPFNYKATREYGAKRIASLPVFSISGDKRVVFAPGNLQAKYTKSSNTWEWLFATNQYDYVGNDSGNIMINGNGTLSADGTVDLFGMSTSINFYGITDSSSTDGTYVDWGTIGTFKHKTVTTTYSSDYWFTLSEGEWKYVVGEDWPRRKNGGTVAGVSDAHCTKATVNGINGFILFPDHYFSDGTAEAVTWEASFIGNDSMGNSGTDGWGATITLTSWTTLEKEGCVFFPAAGEMSAGSTTVNNPGTFGSYKHRNSISYLRFNDDGFDPNEIGFTKASRRSVRLVHEIN